MKLIACSVLDKAVGAFNTPMFFRSRPEAIRSFSDACAKEPAFSRHAEDYTFMLIGEYDDATGGLVGCEPVRLISAVECLVNVDSAVASRSH